MKTLEQYNKEMMDEYLLSLACPTCGSELWDTNPNVKLYSDPPQKKVHCKKCDFFSYRIALGSN